MASAGANDLLQPISSFANNNNHSQNSAATADANAAAASAANVGATWSGNLNAGNMKIDLDSNAETIKLKALKVWHIVRRF